MSDLEEAGYLERERVGRHNRYRVHLDMKLRHPLEEHRTIGAVIELVSAPGRQ